MPDRARRGRFGPDQGRAHPRSAREDPAQRAFGRRGRARAVHLRRAGRSTGLRPTAMLKIMEEPPEGVLFFADGVQHGAVLPTIPQPLRRLYDRAGGDRRVRGRPCARPCPRWTRARPPTSPFCTKGASARRWNALNDPGRKGRPRRRARAVPPCAGARTPTARPPCWPSTRKTARAPTALLAQTMQAVSASLRRPGFRRPGSRCRGPAGPRRRGSRAAHGRQRQPAPGVTLLAAEATAQDQSPLR